MPPTLRDIAEKAGVSPSTVSRVLSGRPGISEATRAKVLEVARKLHYAPDMSAQGLATTQLKNIGLVGYKYRTRWVGSIVPSATLGADAAAQKHGYHIITTYVDSEQMQHMTSLPMVDERRVDGLIAIGPGISARLILHLHSRGVPIVLMDNLIAEAPIDRVLCENREGAYAATKHLLTVRPHKRTVFISGPITWTSSRERYEGYAQAVTEAGLEPFRIEMPNTIYETGYRAMKDLLSRHPDVTAVVAVNDATAVGAIKAAREAGYEVPEDIAFVGFDDVEWASLHDPPLTTVRIPQFEMGYQAVERLIERLDRGDVPPVTIRLASELIIRRSCGANG